MTVEVNIERLRYLLSLYRMEESDLLEIINTGRKRIYTRNQVFTDQIDLRILKKIDTVFEKGMAFYVDPEPISASSSMSIFFRKQHFKDELNLASKKVVTKYESLKNYLSSLDLITGIQSSVSLPHCNTRTSPAAAAGKVRAAIYPQSRCKTGRDFLKALIKNLAGVGVLVIEHLEAANKKEKANLDGIFLSPNFIVIRRYRYYKREIFSLAHELGHLILDKEEAESINVLSQAQQQISSIENWCNEFAYHFLVGSHDMMISTLPIADSTNDYHHPLINEISKKCFISRSALYTRLLYNHRISQTNYSRVIKALEENFTLKIEQEKRALQAAGKKSHIAHPQPIYSPKFLTTLSVALNDGVIRPADIYRLNIPAKIFEGLESWL